MLLETSISRMFEFANDTISEKPVLGSDGRPVWGANL